jgi:hemerythrin-like domain-containing protein
MKTAKEKFNMQLLPQEHGFDQPLGLLSDCHRRVERFLQTLSRVAQDCPDDVLPPKYEEGLRSALDYFRDAAPKHTQDEEDSLFPRIAHSREAALVIERLESEHDFADPLHHEIDRLGRLWLAQTRLNSEQRSQFLECVQSLISLYKEHIRIEDEELFPLAATLLDPAALEDIGTEMAARRGLERREEDL